MMTHRKEIFIIMALASFLLQGCSQITKTPATLTKEADVPEFSVSKGLFLPESTRQALSLTQAEVTEGTVFEQMDFTLRVFSTNTGLAQASGLVAHKDLSKIAAEKTITASTQDGRLLNAEIDRVVLNSGNESGRAEILVRLNGPGPTPAVGEFISGSMTLPGNPESIAIPRSALLECSEGTFVYTISGDRFVRTAVEVGRKNPEHAEIVDGLYTGDEVVTHPVQSLWMTELAAVKGGQSCCLVSPEVQ